MANFQSRIKRPIAWLRRFSVVTSFLKWVGKDGKNRNRFLFWFNICNFGLFFPTALISPWIFLIWALIFPILFLRSNPLEPALDLIQMVQSRTIGFTTFTITVFFMMLHWICLFACVYMIFGNLVDSNQAVITGVWKHFYFSAVTFTTLGYGNLVPANTIAEVIAVIEALVGFGAFALLIGISSGIAIERGSRDPK
ncbi:MAG: hypothetical protein GKR96_06490 [Gammaproteobacteria bacterium]|nr:hypothetical protein [Gammaproteobacteria bacterium]